MVLVEKVPRASYKGFETLEEAQTAFALAFALGFVEAIPARNAVGLVAPPRSPSMVSTNPTQNEILAILSGTPANYLGQTWYAVFKGIRPGVYPCW